MFRFRALWRNILVSRFILAAIVLVLRPAKGADFVPKGATWHYFKGTQEPTPENIPAWRVLDFDDSSWPTGPMPVFYGEPLSGTEVADMRGNYTSIYFRYTFDVANPADVQTLTLRVLSDDGFVAWINDQEITAFNASGDEPDYNATAFTTFTEPLPYDDYPIDNPSAAFLPGRNVLCIHGFNASLSGSSDFVMDPSLSFTRDESAPVVDRILPVNGAIVRQLSSVEIDFSEPVDGVDAADLLINGQAATNAVEFGAGQFVFTFVPPRGGACSDCFSGKSRNYRSGGDPPSIRRRFVDLHGGSKRSRPRRSHQRIHGR